ncbi:SDR family NAD(P)-dependent oxidoreductase [Enhygromyxa salina]|uniref:SDR family NAD(P)-dependent oxidoreductase n=1 Tax=Enhygromyxa salina TaxID=215803 RepID=UPI0006968997|nr:SDR family NAD(P)-dependent oxidoreductase [Enhygromyxa salina]
MGSSSWSEPPLAGRTALVTGASRGLGAAIATRLASDGAHVVVGYRRRVQDAQRVVEAILAAGGSGECVAIEITDAAAVQAIVDELVSRRGSLEILVNNAGVARDEMFAMSSAESWRESLAHNLDGTANCCRAVVRPMLAAGGGTIVNVSSVTVQRGRPGRAAYTAAKGGIEALTRALALELIPRGVRVNAVVPGMFDAGMFKRMRRDLVEQWAAHIPAGRPGQANELAAAVAFLASDASSYVVGQCLIVDGGLSL